VVYYPWHPLFGQEVKVYRHHKEQGIMYYVVRLSDGTLTHIPAWMTDLKICQGFTVSESPTVSLSSLTALWDMLHIGQENINFSRTPSRKSVDEGKGHEEQRSHIPTSVSIQGGRNLESIAIKGTGE